MIQLICNGVEVDVPRGTSIAWKNTNILFAFDKAQCERSLTFTLPSTATNDTVFELCRLPQYVGQGFRRLYDAEYRDGLLVKKGYAYVTQAQKGGYNVTLVVGSLTELKRLKDAGKVGEVLPDTAIAVSKAVQDARTPEYADLKVIDVFQTDTTQQLMPSWCFRPLLVDVLNELQVRCTLPQDVDEVAERLRIQLKGLNGAKATLRFTNVRHSEVLYPTKDALATDKYNTLSITDNIYVSVRDVDCAAVSREGFPAYNRDVTQESQLYDDAWSIVGGREPDIPRQSCVYALDSAAIRHYWFYKTNAYRAEFDIKLTFPTNYPNDMFVLGLWSEFVDPFGSFYCFKQRMPLTYVDTDLLGFKRYFEQPYALSTYPREWRPFCGPQPSSDAQYNYNRYGVFDQTTGVASPPPDTSVWKANVSLAGRTISIPRGYTFIFARREDIACAVAKWNVGSSQTEMLNDLQPRFSDYEYDIEVTADVTDTTTSWYLSKRHNCPDMTAIDMLRSLAAVTGTVLNYSEVNGVTFEPLDLTQFERSDLTAKLMNIKSLIPRFRDYKKVNRVKYKDDDMTSATDMIEVDYYSEAAMITEEADLQVLPFSCIANRTEEVDNDYRDFALLVNPDGRKPSADVLLTYRDIDSKAIRVPLVKNATIQQLCREPLTIEATLHMSNYEYSKIQPFSLIHLNGVDYVWTESSWQKGTATLTLSKLPLTLSEPRPTPPPALYIYYDYLESDGNVQYIDTGVYLGGAESIEIDNFCVTRNGGNRQGTYYGSWIAWNSYNYSLLFANGSTENNYNSRQSSVSFRHVLNTRYRLVKRANVVTIYEGETVIATRTFTLITASSGLNCYLFASNSNGALGGTWGHLRLGVTRMYDSNGVLVRDFRPAVRIADGVAGMHDVLNDVFYTNANPAGDNFLYGNF